MSAANILEFPDLPAKAVGTIELRSTGGGKLRIERVMRDAQLERTIDGASTVSFTVHDPKRTVLRNPIFKRKGGGLGYVDTFVDGIAFRLVKVEKQEDDVVLTFEDRAVAYLRTHFAVRKATRGTGTDAKGNPRVTRAEFALSLVREVRGIGFYSPDLHVVQPIESKKKRKTKKQKREEKGAGIPLSTEGLKVKGADATVEQIQNANLVLDVAASLNAVLVPRLALVEACIVESLLRNVKVGQIAPVPIEERGNPSAGVLQVTRETGRSMGIDPLDPEACAHAFLTRGFWSREKIGGGGAIAIHRRHPEASSGQVAQACQGSGFPERYDQHRAEAQAFLDAYDGGIGPGGAGKLSGNVSVTRDKPFQFRRGGKGGDAENSWEALQRLASDVNWRCFCDQNTVYFVSDETLMRAQPVMVIDEASPGISAIDFDMDRGKPNISAVIVCRASRWTAGPGEVVQLRNCGPGDGRWLVQTIRRPVYDPRTEITLTAAGEADPEQSTEKDTVVTSIGRGRQTGYAKGSTAYRAYRAAWAIHYKHYPYVYGGGHGRAGTPSGGPPAGMDCSAAVSAVLAAAHAGLTRGGVAWDSNRLMSWGAPGRGRYFTVWTKPGGTTGHAFIVFHDPVGDGGEDLHFGTGDFGKGWKGPGFNTELHSTGGFTPRHWPEGNEPDEGYPVAPHPGTN